MELYHDLLKFVQSLEDDFRKFYEKGNKAAGVRLRKGMQDIKAKAQAIRNHIQEVKGTDGQ